MSTGLLGFQSVQERQGGVMEYISPSRLNLWLKCPLAFRCRYLDGIRTPTTPSLFLGRMVHSSLECYCRHRQLGVTLESADVTKRMLETWGPTRDQEGMTFESAADEQALQRQAADLVAAYMAKVPKDEQPLAVEAAVEVPLVDPDSGENLGIPLLGVMDLVLDGDSGLTIIDFKTSSRSSEPLEITHEIQLTSYAWLFRHASQHSQEAGLEIRSLIKTKVAKIEFHRYPARTDVHFQRLFTVVHEYLDTLDAGRFNYRPGFGCGMCDFKEQCSWWAG